MQTTQESVEHIIETGWHHFSVPRYRPQDGPRYQCWCGDAYTLPVPRHKVNEFSAWLAVHAACRPNLAFLEGDAHASA